MLSHAPDLLQWVPLREIEPSEHNSRLFIEEEALEDLLLLYHEHAEGHEVTLPDPPVLRYRGKGKRLEILGGHRRVYAAHLAGVESLPCRVVSLSDQEAYRFILQHNRFVPLTTAEKAYRAVEMQSLGFATEEIEELLGGVSLSRYLTVGRLLSPEMFTSNPKRCDPSIVEWYGAAQLGAAHFQRCFHFWDTGLWDAEDCSREFRKLQGGVRYLESHEKGFRMTTSFDGRKLNVRGTVPLDYYTDHELLEVVNQFTSDLHTLVRQARRDRDTGFGRRQVRLYNPEVMDQYGEGRDGD